MHNRILEATIYFIAESSRDQDNIIVSFYGCEAMLYLEKIKKIVENLREKIPAKTIQYALSTNGLLLSEEPIVKYQVDNDFLVYVSVDGQGNSRDISCSRRKTAIYNDTKEFLLLQQNEKFFTTLLELYGEEWANEN